MAIPNETNAERGTRFLEAYSRDTSEGQDFSDRIQDEGEQLFGDMIADLLHAAENHGIDPEAVIEKGRYYFTTDDEDNVEVGQNWETNEPITTDDEDN